MCHLNPSAIVALFNGIGILWELHMLFGMMPVSERLSHQLGPLGTCDTSHSWLILRNGDVPLARCWDNKKLGKKGTRAYIEC